MKLRNASQNIENNILQKDSSDKFEEKIVSIGFSMILMFIGSSIIGLFGVATGFIGGVILFIIGWFLSKLINKKVFGSERKIEDIKDDEKILLLKMKEIQTKHFQIRDGMNNKEVFVCFTNYPNLRREFDEFLNLLTTYNSSNLALKYRFKHSVVSSKYKLEVDKFNEIYANKKGK